MQASSTPGVIRLAVPERDFGAIAEIMTEALYPTTETQVHEWESRQWEGMIVNRLVAEWDGGVVGYGLSAHQSWQPHGQFEVWVAVRKAQQRRGVGARLYEATLDNALGHGATVITSEVHEGDEASLRFAQARGFRVERHAFESQLDVTAFDETPFAGVIEAVEAGGIRFFSLADMDTPEVRHGLHEVNAATARDIPGYAGDFLNYDDFCQMVFASSWYFPEGQIMAADGDRIVGLAALGNYAGEGCIYNNMTGVLPEYRGRKIALALKLLSIRAARQRGVRYLRTSNDSENAPMLAINRKLGYKPEAGIFRLIRCD